MATINQTELQSFHYAFQLSKKIIFEVDYYRLGGNSSKHFSTSALLFNQPKTDWQQCGQAQDDLLQGFPDAMSFYKKFDPLHLNALTERQYNDVIKGIEVLKSKYNYLLNTELDSNFNDLKEFSKQKVKIN